MLFASCIGMIIIMTRTWHFGQRVSELHPQDQPPTNRQPGTDQALMPSRMSCSLPSLTPYVTNRATYARVKLNGAFKVIPGDPYWCRQESRTVCGRKVQLMPTKIWQRENSKFVDFSDPTQVWRCPSNKRLRISTRWAIKRCHFYFYDNFGKCRPISIILSLLDS